MIKSKSLRQFAENLSALYKSAPREVDNYIKSHNVCFRVGSDQEQFNKDLELCVNAGRIDLVEYLIGRDMHTAFAWWAFNAKPGIITEFFNKESTKAAIALMTLNIMK